MINKQDQHSQTENDETQVGEHLNENDLNDTETKKTSTIPNFIPKILHNDDKIPKDINFLNSKQVLNVVEKWATIM